MALSRVGVIIDIIKCESYKQVFVRLPLGTRTRTQHLLVVIFQVGQVEVIAKTITVETGNRSANPEGVGYRCRTGQDQVRPGCQYRRRTLRCLHNYQR